MNVLKNLYPLFIVSDLAQEVQYFVTRFGFAPVFESDWYVQLQNGEQQLAIMKENSENQPAFLQAHFAGPGVVLTLEVEDAAALRPAFSQDEVLHELTTEEWGQTHFIVRSPGNICVDVVTYTSPEDYA